MGGREGEKEVRVCVYCVCACGRVGEREGRGRFLCYLQAHTTPILHICYSNVHSPLCSHSSMLPLCSQHHKVLEEEAANTVNDNDAGYERRLRDPAQSHFAHQDMGGHNKHHHPEKKKLPPGEWPGGVRLHVIGGH